MIDERRAEETASELRAGTFYLDGYPEDRFEGFAREDERWNGWACPFFPGEGAHRIADFFAGLESSGVAYRAEYDREADAFRFWDPDGDHWDEYESVEVGGRTLYPIGAYAWTWRRATPEKRS